MNWFSKSPFLLTVAFLIIISAAITIPLLKFSIRAHAEDIITISEFAIPTSDGHPQSITTGPDGNLWFTENTGQKIGRITPDGHIDEFIVSIYVNYIAAGPDGNIWFTGGGGGK
jgi:hypothetical protein